MTRDHSIPFDDGAPSLRLTGGPEGWASASDGAPDKAGPADPRKLVHELANLLDGSLRNVGLALRRIEREGFDSDDHVLDHLRTSELTLRQMASLLNGWQVNAGVERLAGNAADFTLGQIAEHATKIMHPVAEAQDITLAVHIDPAVRRLNLPMLQPVILNGLRNAVEAIGRGGSVELTARTAGDDVEIRITDDGPGVDPSLARDADGLVPAGASTKSTGQGLGLAISRDLVRAMGGTMRLEDNDDLGHGAVLVLRLPLTPARSDG